MVAKSKGFLIAAPNVRSQDIGDEPLQILINLKI